MFKYFFIIFIVAPLLELYLLIEVGSQIGALPTILLTIATALIGGLLMKHQGLQVLQQAKLSMAKGEVPQQAAVEGVLVFLGGVLLLLPGLVTDVLGLLLLIAPVRAYLAKGWLARTAKRPEFHYVRTEWVVEDPISGEVSRKTIVRRSADDVIEGEVVSKKDS